MYLAVITRQSDCDFMISPLAKYTLPLTEGRKKPKNLDQNQTNFHRTKTKTE